MRKKVVFITMGPKFEGSPIPFYLLTQFASKDSEVSAACDFEFMPLMQIDELPWQSRQEWLYRKAQEVLAKSPDLIAFSLYCWNTKHLLMLARICRQLGGNISLLAGGPDTLGVAGELLAKHPALDFVIAAPEGEFAFHAFLRHWLFQDGSPFDIPYAYFREEGRIARGAKTTLVDSLDDIPSAILAHDVSKLTCRFYRNESPAVILETSRSCPVNCAFCQYPKMLRSMRYYSLERVFSELDHLRRGGVRGIYFADGILTLRKERAAAIFKYFLEDYTDCHIHCEVKLDILPEELSDSVRALMEEGRLSFGIGIQSTNKETLKRMGRPCDFAKLERKAKQVFTKAAGRWDLIYGLPGDRFGDVLRSIDYINNLMPGSYIAIQPLLALPGTEYRDSARSFGFVFNDEPPYEILRSDTFSCEDMKRARVLADLYLCFEPFWGTLYREFPGRLPTLMQDLFDDRYFDYVQEWGWLNEVAHRFHFSLRMQAYFQNRGFAAEDVQFIAESLDWLYLNYLPKNSFLDPRLLRLSTAVPWPETKKSRRGKPPPQRIVQRDGSQDSRLFRFRFLRKSNGKFSVQRLAHGTGARYYLLRHDKGYMLTEEGLQILSSFREPRSLEEALRHLKRLSPAWRDVSSRILASSLEPMVEKGLLAFERR